MKDQITQTLVRKLKARSRDFFVWDSVLPGFGLKVTPAGRRSYVFQYRLGGRAAPTKRITIGSDGEGWSAASARMRARELSGMVEGEKLPLSSATPRQPAPPRKSHAHTVETWQIRLGFLANDIARLQNTLLRRTMKSLGASHTQWAMLGRLALNQGVTQMELAKILGLSKVAVTGLVNRVVRAGWVERRLDERDKRVRRLYLTRRSKTAVAAMRDEVDIMTAQSMGHIADDEGQEIVLVLEGIKDCLQQMGHRGGRKTATTPK
jgi:DNA-binding MarR family transcriptional regulator